jgi:hypothetical protein
MQLSNAFARLSNAALRQIIEDDKKLRKDREAWATPEGYAAIHILGTRRTWGTLDKFEDGMSRVGKAA